MLEGAEVSPSETFYFFFFFFALFVITVPERENQSPTWVITVLQRGYRSPTEGSRFCIFSLVSFHLICPLYSLYFFITMSPALLHKSSIQSGNAEQCTLVFIHLLSSSCTSYFYNISYMFVLIVNA